jgi:DNA-binding Xre family transcriptional regulator
MSLKYYKLFDLLQRRGMKRTDLLKFITSPTLARLGKGESVNTEIIERICAALGVQPGDIMEYVEDEPPEA